jgi:lysophospholipase L1-like esterase
MKIHCFGDSWVFGVGVEVAPGSGQLNSSDGYDNDWDFERSLYSWPAKLKSKLSNVYEVENYGSPGLSNNDIYKNIINCLYNNTVKKGDLVIIGLSSIIREPLNFLYTQRESDGFVNYSNSSLLHYLNGHDTHLHWISNLKRGFQKITTDVYKDYITHRFNYTFLYEMNMNYICNLQIYFDMLGIKYLFVNSFEYNLSKEVSFYNKINLANWILPDYTLQEYLIDKSKEMDNSLSYSVWEDDYKNVEKCQDGPHPNRIGYELIADLIFNELINKDYVKS